MKKINTTRDRKKKSLGGSLQKYANISLIGKEDEAWKEHIAIKYKLYFSSKAT